MKANSHKLGPGGPPVTQSEIIRGDPGRESALEVQLKGGATFHSPPTMFVGTPYVPTLGPNNIAITLMQYFNYPD